MSQSDSESPSLVTALESRSKLRSFGLAAMTLLGVALCVFVAYPLSAPILWATVLAVVASPLHRWVERRIGRPSLAAGLVTAAVALLAAVPFSFIATELVLELSDAVRHL